MCRPYGLDGPIQFVPTASAVGYVVSSLTGLEYSRWLLFAGCCVLRAMCLVLYALGFMRWAFLVWSLRLLLSAFFAVAAYFCAGHGDFDLAILFDLFF